jgi:hypothetical protein
VTKPRYASVELDFVVRDEETIEWAIMSVTSGFDVSARLTAKHGPGSGHPLIRVSGPTQSVINFMVANGYDVEDYAEAFA